MSDGTVAEVDAPDLDAALDTLATATDLLRVFQKVRYGSSPTASFGLPGQVYRSSIEYLALGERAGAGYRRRGQVLGWTFDEKAKRAWDESPAFTSLATSLVAPGRGGGPDRALIGVQLLSQAILEHRPAFKMLNLIIALESMLLDRAAGSQGLRLARRAAYFTCGRHNDSLCGRDRASCPCLGLDPANKAGRTSLTRLRQVAQVDARWRCSEWLRYLRWYDLRSSVAHGDAAEVGSKEASRAEYWILRWTAEPVLTWLAEHESQPLADLDAALARLPPPPEWTTNVPDPTNYDPEGFDPTEPLTQH